MLSKERLAELFRNFVISEEMPDEEMPGLTMEELTYIHAAAEAAKKDERFKNVHFPIKQQIVYWAMVEAIKNADEVYVAYTQNPQYPYIDPTGAVWMFSTPEISKKAVDHVVETTGQALAVRKLEKRLIVPIFAQLYYYGVDKVIFDNGSHPLIVERKDVLQEPDWSKLDPKQVPLWNGKLQHSMIQFLQNAYRKEDFPDKQKILKVLEVNMLANLVEAKFLVPVQAKKDGENVKSGENAFEQGNSVRFAVLKNQADDSEWTPAFTEWSEFLKVYKKEEWGAITVPYETLVKLAERNHHIVINAKGDSFRMDETIIKRVEEFREQKKKIDEARANGQTPAPASAAGTDSVKSEPAAAKQPSREQEPAAKPGEAVYGDVLVQPSMFIQAAKKYAKSAKTIKRLWLAAKVLNGTESYLMVVEGANNDSAVQDGLKSAVSGYLDGKELEIHIADNWAMNIVKDMKPFYKKGIFG